LFHAGTYDRTFSAKSSTTERGLLSRILRAGKHLNRLSPVLRNVERLLQFPWAVGFDRGVPFISNYGHQGPGHPTSGVIGLGAFDPYLRSAYIYKYNFGIQRRIGISFYVEADYQGSNGHKLMVSIDQNKPRVIVNDPTKGGRVAPNEQIFPYRSFARIYDGQGHRDFARQRLGRDDAVPGSPRTLPVLRGLLTLTAVLGRA
jgi:hypothetical protein